MRDQLQLGHTGSLFAEKDIKIYHAVVCVLLQV